MKNNKRPKLRVPVPPPGKPMKSMKDYDRVKETKVDCTEYVDSAGKLKSLVPIEEIEWGARKQLYDVINLPCLRKLAIMPDVHQGYDLPIGGVALLDGFISPSFVGFDLGCGVCSVDTGLTAAHATTEDLQAVYNDILKHVPTGFSSLKNSNYEMEYPTSTNSAMPKEVKARVQEKSVMQLGTLGGGNHFIELGENRAGNICVTIHSGSRNVGHTIGDWYMKQGRMFPLFSDLGISYINDLQFALDWALKNRLVMIQTILSVLGLSYKEKSILKTLINENHNHAEVTDWGVLHRKGATPAAKDQLGIIPANMRDGVYITKGLGNEEYLCSASHGCGRKLGRNAAKKSLDYEEFKAGMEGIVCSTDKAILDEAPAAYKDPDYVINAQEGIVITVVDYIKPMLNIKAVE